jgi:cardiolipin synthase A/B
MSTAVWSTLLAILVIVQLLVIWSIRRHRDPSLKIECDAPIADLMPSLAGLTLGTAVAGNRFEVLENGAYFASRRRSIRSISRPSCGRTGNWVDGWLTR